MVIGSRAPDQGGRSPRIVDVAWGRMETEAPGVGKDFELYPGGGRDWDWAETGTRRAPGTSPPTCRSS